MDQKLKKKWIEALTSGKYQQAKSRLKDPSGFCCLGVLRDVNDPDDCEQNEYEELLDTEQLRRFGLTGEIQEKLAELNDLENEIVDNNIVECGPVPFDMIAGLIDEAL